MTWRDHLRTRLLEIQPESVCALDAAARQLASEVLPDTPVRTHDPLPDTPCALALGIDVLNGLDAQQAQHLISQTRLYVAPRILLVVQSGCVLDEAMFRALGFTLSATDPAADLRIHYYDLDTYTPTRRCRTGSTPASGRTPNAGSPKESLNKSISVIASEAKQSRMSAK